MLMFNSKWGNMTFCKQQYKIQSFGTSALSDNLTNNSYYFVLFVLYIWYIYIYIYQLNIAQMSSECSIEKLERNIRNDKSTQDLAWHIYYYLVSYRTTCAALIR